MKTVLITTGLLCMLSFSLSAQQDLIQPSVSLPGHPRILLLKGEESLIQKTIDLDPAWKDMHNVILAGSDEILSLPPVERIQIGRRLLDKSRECLRRVFYLSYAWRMTNDRKYFLRAEKELLAVSAFSDWNPSHFLDVAEMTMAVAIGYDWLFPALSTESKNKIREAIRKKGIDPSLSERNNSWLKTSNNWNQVCNAGMTYGALAIFEDDPVYATQIINRAITSIRLPMEDFNPDGAYPEGYGYWGYGSSFNIMFLSAAEKAFKSDFGLSSQPGFLKTAGYLENMTGPCGKCFNYSDSGVEGGLNPAMFWFANRVNNFSLLWSEKTFMKTDKNKKHDRLLPAIMIWGAGISMDRIHDPVSLTWVGQGKNPVALMRSSWTDPDAIYAGLKAGSPSVNHAHMDVGSFIMDADGVRWAMDFGPEDYNSIETKGISLWDMTQFSQRWQIFRYNNLSHNTLTVNNEFQSVKGYAKITGYSSSSSYLSATTDLTEVYNGQLVSAKRGIALVDKSYLIIRDEVQTPDRQTLLKWTMLTPAEVKITGKGIAELTQQGKKLLLKVQEPENISLITWTTVPTHDYDSPNPGTTLVGFEMKIAPNQKKNLTILLIPHEAEGKNVIKSKALKDWPMD